jgi:hypothetical protein
MKLCLARPQGSDSASTSDDGLRLARPRARTHPRHRKTVSASPDPRARTQPRHRKTVSASPDPGLGLNLDLGRRTPPRPTQGSDSTSTPDDGLRLARPQGSDSTSTSEDGLHLARPRARTPPRPRKTVSASPDLGLRLNLDLGRRSPPRPTPGLGLHLDLGRRSPPCPTQGSDSTSTSDDGLRLARPRAQTQPRPWRTVSASPDPGLGLSLDLGGITASPSLGLGPTTLHWGPSLPYP